MLEQRKLCRGGSQQISFTELGFGTAPLGNMYKDISDEEAQATLDLAWESGVRFFDTAPLYGHGLSETRLNRFLRTKPRQEYVLSTKAGRLLRPLRRGETPDRSEWFNTPARRQVFDYSYDGIMRSLEFSLERLGVDQVDVLHVHDLCIFTHGSKDASDARIGEFFGKGGYDAMISLREQGVVKAIGGGVNEWEVCQTLAERGDFDLFLLAGRYTLLEQDALDSFLPLCTARNIGVVIGGPYNSGILATGAVPQARYNYAPAPAEVIEKVRSIETICRTYEVPLIAAALQFPLRHPAVVSVIPGGQSKQELLGSVTSYQTEIPDALWGSLKSAGLIRQDAPI